uniref:Short myomegalin-like EB1 binding protein N-terminal domain-containing protein n=1 Tax=Tetraodon nigroviridis TaxID=99883 RepID=H3D9R0_TETNG
MRMREACRICGRQLCGNQRRWIFHPAARVSLQALLSHALGRPLSRDGRGEFACSKCVFLLDRMFRFDAVIARVEALSLERLHRLLLERDRLRQGIGGLYRKNNPEDGDAPPAGPVVRVVGPEDADVSGYSDLVREDLTLSVHESWADAEPEQHQHLLPCPEARPRRCRGCAALRVADSDYEAVCRVPRRLGRRSTSCGPSSRCSDPSPGAQDPVQTPGASDATDSTLEPSCSALDTQRSPCGGTGTSPSPASSLESLDLTVGTGAPPADHEEDRREEPEEDKAQSPLCGPETLLDPLRGCEYRPPKLQGPSRIPVLLRAKVDQDLAPAPLWSGEGPADLVPQRDLRAELVEMQEDWEDHYGSWEAQEPLVTSDLSHVRKLPSLQERLRGQEPQKNQEQVRSLQARNQELQERLAAMQLRPALGSGRSSAATRGTSRTSATVLAPKEEEVATLRTCFRVIEEQNALLCSPGEVARRCPLQASGAEAEVLTLQASLFQAQLELQAGQRAHGGAARTQQDLQRALQRLEADLQGALQHRRTTERHNQELRRALEELRPALLEAQRCQAEQEQERRRGGEEQEATIRQLRSSLLARDQLIEDCELLEDRQETRDRLLQKLRIRVRERDRALQRAVDDKFDYVKEKEEESRRLQRLVGEAEREAARQRGVLADNQESIAQGLQLLLRARSLELQQLRESCQKLQQQQQDSEHRHVRALKERDAVISQLQVALQTHAEESQVLRSSLLLPSAPSSVLEELKLRLQLKDRLFQEVLADRTQQAQEHQEQVQELLGTLRSRDQYIQVDGE